MHISEPQSRTVDKFTNFATNDDIQILIFKFTRKIGVPTFNHHTCLYLLSILAANNISIFSIFNDPVVDIKKTILAGNQDFPENK